MDWIASNQQSLLAFLPELYLSAAAIAFLALRAKRGVITALGVLAFVIYALLSWKQWHQGTQSSLFAGMIAIDSFAIFFKFFFAGIGAVNVILLGRSWELRDARLSEIVAFLLAITVGLSMMAASTDMLMMILSIELVSVLSYVMVAFRRNSERSSEAGLKYLLYGAMASGVMVFGLSFMFGLVGSTALQDVAAFFQNLEGISLAPIIGFSLLCVMIGIGYKIATFPSHMWCPDVYEGAPMPVTMFLSVAPKAAGFAMIIRFLYGVFNNGEGGAIEIYEFMHWTEVLSIIAIITMTLGNLAALAQPNLKRLMAYSSIAHGRLLADWRNNIFHCGCSSRTFLLNCLLFYEFWGIFDYLGRC